MREILLGKYLRELKNKIMLTQYVSLPNSRTAKDSNFAPHGNFAHLLARSVARSGELNTIIE